MSIHKFKGEKTGYSVPKFEVDHLKKQKQGLKCKEGASSFRSN